MHIVLRASVGFESVYLSPLVDIFGYVTGVEEILEKISQSL